MKTEIFIKSDTFRQMLFDNYGESLEIQWENYGDSLGITPWEDDTYFDRTPGLGPQDQVIFLKRIFKYKTSKTSIEIKTLIFDLDEMGECKCTDWNENGSGKVYKKIAELIGNNDDYISDVFINEENIDDKGIPKNGDVLIWFSGSKYSRNYNRLIDGEST